MPPAWGGIKPSRYRLALPCFSIHRAPPSTDVSPASPRGIENAGSIPAASIILSKPNPVCAECHAARGIESGAAPKSAARPRRASSAPASQHCAAPRSTSEWKADRLDAALDDPHGQTAARVRCYGPNLGTPHASIDCPRPQRSARRPPSPPTGRSGRYRSPRRWHPLPFSAPQLNSGRTKSDAAVKSCSQPSW